MTLCMCALEKPDVPEAPIETLPCVQNTANATAAALQQTMSFDALKWNFGIDGFHRVALSALTPYSQPKTEQSARTNHQFATHRAPPDAVAQVVPKTMLVH